MPTKPSSKHYRRITIIGTGAVGCSIACLARGNGLVDEVVGVDRDTAHLEMARRLGFIDRAEEDPARGVMGAEAVVFAVPLDEIFMVVQKAGADIRPDALVTCTAGTTQRLWSQLINEVPAMTTYDVPQHYRSIKQRYPDITAALQNLRDASQNLHLPAFQRCAV